MLYYGIISLCAVMFGMMFFFNQMFQKSCGDTLKSSIVFSLWSALAGIIILSAISGFKIGYTHFSLIMAVIVAVNGFAFTFCSFMALGKINLSLYSVFSMLGGMALPFVAGILFYGEPLTLGKIICFAFITFALFLTVKKGDKNNSGFIYYLGIFVFNGLSGVLSKIYTDAPEIAKIGTTEYSILCAIVAFVMSAILLLFIRGEKIKMTKKAVVAIIGSGFFSKIPNYLLLVSLVHLPASAQYPFITGGTMIVSTVIAYITHQRPSKREILSVAFSFAGLMALVLIP